MAQFDKILAILETLQPISPIEEVELENSFNRILREDVIADISMPPFDKSAMDGYACRYEDVGNEMQVLEVISAGKVASEKIGPNQCSKIMTGAAVPEGADCVFMVEHSKELADGNIVCTNPNTAKNICYKGEDYSVGETLIKKGVTIKESHIAVLAGAGYSKVKVSQAPKIALVTTGSELVEPDEIPPAGKIRNSNASQVRAQLQKTGLSATYLGLAEDNYDALLSLVKKTLNDYDILIFTGGASVGDFDFIPHIINELGFQKLWDRTGLKPGNPMAVAQNDNKFCIGLSGNPVSSFIQFELIAKPLLFKLQHANFQPIRLKAQTASHFYRKKADRVAIIPVKINAEGKIEDINFHGSAHINALVYANALMEIPVGVQEINSGEFAYVRPI